MQSSAEAVLTDTVSIKPARLDKFFVPARSSRHRIAVIALYRALLALATTVPLPADFTQAWDETRAGRPAAARNAGVGAVQPDASAAAGHEAKQKNKSKTENEPLVEIVRRTFRRNRSDTSPRIVHPALLAGYRSLALLRDAQNPDSPGNRQVLALLQDRLAERKRSLAAKAASSRDTRRPSENDDENPPESTPQPLLVRISPDPTPENPFPKPEYVTPNRPRPVSDLGGSGRRHVPHIDMANDFPFLRIRKPQSELLTQVLKKKIDKRVARLEHFQELHGVDLGDAKLEDEWESLCARQANAELRKRTWLARQEAGSEQQQEQKDEEEHEAAEEDKLRTPSGRRLSPASKAKLHRLYAQDPIIQLIDRRSALEAEHQAQLQTRLETLGTEHRSDQTSFLDTGSFNQSIWHHGVTHIERTISYQRDDYVARARALRNLVAQEKALAEREKQDRDRIRREKWEAEMAARHGADKWRDVVAEDKRRRDQARQERIKAQTEAARTAAASASAAARARARAGDPASTAAGVEAMQWRRHVPRPAILRDGTYAR